MPPFILALLSQGLGLIGNAALAKGKEWVEEKTGVKLQPDMPPEDLVKLKQYEYEHEEELQKLKQEDSRIDLEGFKAEVSDKQSARERDTALTKAGTHNYRADFMFFLAVALVTVMIWIVWKDPSINEYAKGIFTLVLGRFLGYLDNIYNFEFGTTRGSRNKDATIDQLTKGDQP